MLIVLGHNKYLMKGGYCFSFLYSFHVYSFYFLPFLYNFKLEKFKITIIKNLRRLYIPYTFFFLVLISTVLLQKDTLKMWDIFISYICGSQTSIRGALNEGGFLWFIPTYFSILIFRWLYYNKTTIRPYILCASGICLFCYAYGFLNLLQIYIPANAFIGLAMLLPAVIIRYFCNKINTQNIGLLFFVLMIIILIIYPASSKHFYIYRTINRFICPIIIFLFLFSMKDVYSKSKFLIKLGHYSFPIYIYHVFIYNLFYMLCNKYNIKITLFDSLLLYGIVLFIAYSIQNTIV